MGDATAGRGCRGALRCEARGALGLGQLEPYTYSLQVLGRMW